MSFMADLEHPLPKDEHNQPGTRFSFYRFMIPELAGYRGKALYLDSDMMVFKDMRELWELPFDGAQVLTVRTREGAATKNHSVLLIDCGAVDWNIRDIVRELDEGRYDYDRLMRDLCIVAADRAPARIPYVWNSLDTYEPGVTALLHFTALHSQPWTDTRHPFARLWVEALSRTLEAGAITLAVVRNEVEAGHVRPSLLYQLESRMVDPAALPAAVLKGDRGFVAPYRRLSKHSVVQQLRRRVRLIRRNLWPR
jgi:lipopolysaccharide biosynthesis glycosyltransferase